MLVVILHSKSTKFLKAIHNEGMSMVSLRVVVILHSKSTKFLKAIHNNLQSMQKKD